MVKINGSSFPHQYRRTNPFPIDSTETWPTIEDATAYARNEDEEAYMPYSGQVISIEGEDDLYVLVDDDRIPNADERSHFKLHKISTEEGADGKYIRKDIEDKAAKLIHFLEGIDVEGILSARKAKIFDEIYSADYAKNVTGWLINKEGLIEANKAIIRELLKASEIIASKKVTTLDLLVQALADLHDLSVSHVATLMRTVIKDYVSSETFVSGFSGEGMKIYKALDGSWNMEIDNLTVRKIFSVFELVVQKMTHQGGMVIRSAAGAKLTKVTDGGSYWKCEHDSTDDFVKDDQVICQAFTGKSAKRYWRLVTSAGAGYFNLSKTDCETGSSSPEPGDDVAVLGNRTNTARQKAQIDCAIGDTAPYRDDYAGINSYSLAGKLITRTGELSGITDSVFGVLSGSGLYGTNVYLKGMFILHSGKTVEEEITGAIEDIEIGGRNLLMNTKTFTGWKNANGATLLSETYQELTIVNQGGSWVRLEQDYSFEAGQTYSLSAFVRSTTGGTALYVNAPGNSKELTRNLSTEWQRVSYTFTVSEDTVSPAYFVIPNVSSTGSLQICGYKLEKGNKATDWTPAPEDVENRITTVETNFEIREGQISSKVTEVTTAVTNAKKSETAAAGSASTAVSKAGEASAAAANAKKSADDATAKLVTITEKESSINQTAGNITLQVKEVTRKATEASGSASAAAGSASTATAKAGEAATSATNAKKSADDASAKLVSITEKESSINQTASGITLQVKEVTTKAGEAAAAATNAKKSETGAAGSATAAANSAGSAAASLQSVTTKESSINQTASKITLQVSEVTTKTDQATKAAELASAMSQGKMLYSDPTFASGNNGIGAYGTTNISVSRINAIAGNPNDSGFSLKITCTGLTGNRWGGFYFGTAGKYNRVLVCRFIAKIPTGYNIVFATNSLGNGAKTTWLTENKGTGSWTEYACKVVYGSSGTISTTMFFALEGGATPTASSPLVWYLCYATVFDLAASSTDDFVTKTVYDAGIKVLKDSIDLKVNTTTFNALGNRVTAAESAITVAQNAIEQRVTKTEYNKVGRLVAYGTNSDAAAISYVVLNEAQLNHSGRGFTLFKINRTTLEFAKVGTYDVYAGGANFTNFVNALNAIDVNYIVVVISWDAIAIDTATANALAAYGGSGMTCATTRRSYVLVGQKGIGKGNGLEQWKQSTAGNVTISTTIINGAVTGFFGGGNTASALTSAETRITQTENSIRLKADQTIVDGINTRLQSAEAKITPDAIKLTVKSQTETIAANAAKRTELWMDARGLDVTKYYPITIGMNATIPYIITVQRTLYAGHGKPSWSTHNEGFSVMCRWQSNGSGWGTIAIQRTILDYAYGFANVVPVGSISQITEASLEYIYVRGGSKYCVIVEGATGVNISLKTSAYTWTSGTTARTLDIKTEVTAPLVDLKQRPTTDTIKSQITLDGFGVSVFGKKIDFTGQVTFNSLNSSLQGTINDKATGAQVTAAQTAANNAQTTANIAKTNAATAQSTADTAKSSAESANSLLADIANDNKLTPSEKQQTKKEWDAIVSEKVKNDASADKFGVSKTAYGTAYSNLSTYVTPLLSSLTTTSAIAGTTFRANFKAYYDARTDLLNAISEKARTLATTAQSTADTAKNNASAAQTTANNVNTALNTLKTSLKGMAYQDMVTLAKLDTTIIEGGHIKTSLIDANAIVTGTLVAGIISTTDITTGRLTATTGAKIGGFKVEGDRLTSADAKGSLMIGDNMVRFFRINEYGTGNQSAALLQIRNDKGSAVSLSGGADKTVLSIIGNGAKYAVESYGSHVFGQRSGETWNAPGALFGGRIIANGTLESRWGDGCGKRSPWSQRISTGKYRVYHYLGHTQYYTMATPTNMYNSNTLYTWAICLIASRTSDYVEIETVHPTAGNRDVIIEFVLIGRNNIN